MSLCQRSTQRDVDNGSAGTQPADAGAVAAPWVMHALGLVLYASHAGCAVHHLDPPLPARGAVATPGVADMHETYTVRGRQPESVRRALNQRSTWRDATGERFDGGTTWSLHWRHTFETAAEGCRIVGLAFSGTVTVTTPSLRTWHRTDPKLGNRWTAYLVALWGHEQHHVDRVHAAIDEARAAVVQLPAQSTCAAAGTAANDAVQTVFAAMNIDQVAYDTATHHGQLEGAFWDTP